MILKTKSEAAIDGSNAHVHCHHFPCDIVGDADNMDYSKVYFLFIEMGL